MARPGSAGVFDPPASFLDAWLSTIRLPLSQTMRAGMLDD